MGKEIIVSLYPIKLYKNTALISFNVSQRGFYFCV